MRFFLVEGLEFRHLLAATPVAFYTFEEGSGTTSADNSGSGNNLNLINGLGFGQGLIGRYSSQFDGSNDYASVNNSSSLNPTSALSITAWINATDWNGNRRIVQKGGNDNQYRLTAEFGVLKFDIKNVGAAFCPLPMTGVWHYVAGTYDGSMLRIYVDGQLVGGGSGSGSIPVTGETLNIGTKNGGSVNTDHFFGRIDDVRIYNVALGDADIQNLAGITNINFQPAAAAVPQTFLVDSGSLFGDRGNGFSYGWNTSHTGNVFDRNIAADQRLDTLVQMHSGAVWELAVPNGSYEVIAGVGDASQASTNTINIEGVNFFNAVGLGANAYSTVRKTVTVSDGRITLDNGAAAEGITRLDYVQVLALQPIPNTPPATPTITEPSFDGKIVNPADVHMEAPVFSDPDPGDTHASSDWELRVASTNELVWLAYDMSGIEKVHIHLGDGKFIGSHTSRTELLAETDYILRVRHRDNRGAASAFSQRLFTTGPRSSAAPLDLDDVAATPPPTWVQASNTQPVELPVGTSMSLGGSDGSVILQFNGLPGTGNLVTNPPALLNHVHSRIFFAAASTTLTLPESNLIFSDETGASYTVYLPAVSLGPGQSAYFWVGSDGSTYAGDFSQIDPNFDTPARLAPIPYLASQPGYAIDVFATGFQLPVNIAFVPNPGPNPSDILFYVTELYGTIKAVTRDGTSSIYASGLLNFNPTGDFPGSGEQGLSGIVIDPATGDIYADMVYSSVNGVEGVPHYPKVVRFTSTDGGHTAATQTTILDMPGETMGQSHFVSNLSIGPDGKLYVHVGDGFDQTKGQDLTSFRGKILRLNLNGTPPTDNPFYNASDGITAKDYVYAYGFRNPFAGAWRASDGKQYEAENGPAVDRLAQVVPGRNYLYDGSDASMANFAIFNWNPSVAPVNAAFIQSSTFGGSGFPASKLDHLFVTESGPTYASGVQTLGKKITEFVLDSNGNRISGPTNFITYAGSGKGTFGALAAGPDGLYFAEIYKDQDFTSPIDQGARIFRIAYTGGTPPAVSVTPLTTTDTTPPLTGTVNDPAATVQVSVNGHVYSAVNNGNGTWTLADNIIAPPLPDGTYDVQVSATNTFGTVGTDPTIGELVIDTTPPQITSTQFLFDSPIIPGRPHTVRMVLSENIVTLTSDDLVLTNLGSESTVPSADIALSYDSVTRTALFTFPGFAGGVLPDGNYSVTLAPGSISDPLGNALAPATPSGFFVLSADANHDRKVDETDLGILSLNWQQSPRTFLQGDFDYNGLVDVNDLNILASHWQQSLAAPTASPAPKGGMRKPVSRVFDQVLG